MRVRAMSRWGRIRSREVLGTLGLEALSRLWVMGVQLDGLMRTLIVGEVRARLEAGDQFPCPNLRQILTGISLSGREVRGLVRHPSFPRGWESVQVIARKGTFYRYGGGGYPVRTPGLYEWVPGVAPRLIAEFPGEDRDASL